jgi:two-component system, NtrC family, response regulator AtoC
MSPRILIVEDEPQFACIVKSLLEREGFSAEILHNVSEVRDGFIPGRYQAVLLDLFLSGRESGLEVLRHLKQSEPHLPVVIMTANGSMDTVAEALRLNAFDYVTKPFEIRAITEILGRALARRNEEVSSKRAAAQTPRLSSIIGKSPPMIDLFKAIARVSQTDSTVLVSGESGTGKELVARAIHDNSPRKDKPFIAVNCGALTETLLESELFGHVRGAFTGAQTNRSGFFESASGGTIFLDEISETAPVFQVKLLRVLQERMIRPVGSSQERPVNVRVIAATNLEIQALLNSSAFRRDLLYRLSVIHIQLPPLRERREDIPLLLSYFIQRFSQRQNKSVRLPEQTIEWVQRSAWPGNVRELENAVERAVTMNTSGSLLAEDFLQFGIPSAEDSPSKVERVAQELRAESKALETEVENKAAVADEASPGSLDEMTRGHILEALHHTKGNKVRAAEILGIGRYSLYRMAKRLSIDLEDWRVILPSPRRKRGLEPAASTGDHLDLEAFDQLDDIVYTRDFAGVITSINAAGERFLGIPRDQIVGRSVQHFVDPANKGSLTANNEKLLSEGHGRFEWTVRDREGRARVLEFNLALFRDSAGQPAGARGIARDVTDAKELESRLRSQAQQLEEANEKLKELNRIKADFTAMLVHDLKTPISTMMMTLQLLQEILPSEANDDLHKMIAGGLASGRSMVQIVEDMLELFRHDSTQLSLVSARVSIEDLIQDPFSEALVQAQLKGLELTRQIEQGLPDVLVDRVKICRVLSNLLSNALNFTQPGGRVRIEAQKSRREKWMPWMRKGASVHIEGMAEGEASGDRSQGFVQFSVCDTGIGISPDNLSYIFDPYWHSKREATGTGLGLAVVKRIVTAHRGFLAVRSRVGVGSEFYFTLPAAEDAPQTTDPPKSLSATNGR